MRTKESFFESLEYEILRVNRQATPMLENSMLRQDTDKAIKLLNSYFMALQTLWPTFDFEDNDFDKYPVYIQEVIHSIINVVSDGRDTPSYKTDENGRLPFENNPYACVQFCLNCLESLHLAVKNEKITDRITKDYIDGKWRTFQGYEQGAVSVKFKRIGFNAKGEFVFDGDVIYWATPDSEFEATGIVFNPGEEDVNFSTLPYSSVFRNVDELMRFLEDHNKTDVQTDSEIFIEALDCLKRELKEELRLV